MDRVTALGFPSGSSPDNALFGVPTFGGAGPGRRPRHLVLDLPHAHAAARARFARPAPFPLDALAWAADGVAGEPLPEGVTAGPEFVIERHIGWLAAATDDVDATDVVKQVSFLQAADGITLDEFRAHYRAHVDVARKHMPALWQYVQNDVVDVAERGHPSARGFVAISELWFRTTDDFLHRYFPSAADEAEFRSHEGFLDLSKAFSFICTSYERD